MFAHSGPYGTWLIGRILKVIHQVAAPGAKCDVYDCYVRTSNSGCKRGIFLASSQQKEKI